MPTDTDHLRTFFIAFGPALNRSGLEAILHLPTKTVRFWLACVRDLPDAHRHKLLAWARRYGYQEHIQYDPFL